MPWYHYTPLFRIVATGQTAGVLASAKGRPEYHELITYLTSLPETDIVKSLSAEAQEDISQGARKTIAQYYAWERRGPVSQWLPMALYLLAMPAIAIADFWTLGERVFNVRNDAYLVLFMVMVLAAAFSPRANKCVFQRLNRDYLTTLPVMNALFSIVAFIPGTRGWYGQFWFVVLTIALPLPLIYWLMFHDIIRSVLRERRAKRPRTTMHDSKIVAILGKLDKLRGATDVELRRSDKDPVQNIQHSLWREGLSQIERALARGLSTAAYAERVKARNSLSARKNRLERRTKQILTAFATALMITSNLSLVKNWGTFAQFLAFALSLLGLLFYMSFSDDYPLPVFMDFYVPKIVSSFLIFFQVSIPLLIDKKAFDNSHILFWVMYGCIAVEIFFLNYYPAHVLTELLKRRLASGGEEPVPRQAGPAVEA